jgi:hypothetical protein
MTDAISAITSSSIPAQQLDHELISPEDLATFESEYRGEDVQFSSIYTVDSTKAGDLSDNILQHLIKIDDGYHRIFSNKLVNTPKNNISSESKVLQTQSVEQERSESPSTNDMLLETIHDTHAWGVDMMNWSLQLQIVTNTVTTTSTGLNSLLKSGG